VCKRKCLIMHFGKTLEKSPRCISLTCVVISISVARVQTSTIMGDNEHVAQDHRQQYRAAW